MLELYAAGTYFTMQTLTTVGYGDIAIVRMDEIMVVTLLQFIGVLCFSFASGSLTSLISNTEDQQSQVQEKLIVLNRLLTEYKLPKDLYFNLRAQLQVQDSKKTLQENMNFLEELPFRLRMRAVMFIFHEFHEHVPFLRQ
jgi:hypothetical protein